MSFCCLFIVALFATGCRLTIFWHHNAPMRCCNSCSLAIFHDVRLIIALAITKKKKKRENYNIVIFTTWTMNFIRCLVLFLHCQLKTFSLRLDSDKKKKGGRTVATVSHSFRRLKKRRGRKKKKNGKCIVLLPEFFRP